MCSADYDKNNELTKKFFATVQNKLHFAVSGQTAAEIIHSRADKNNTNMGLTTWKNAPKGAIRKTDVSIAKNYLNEEEIDELNRVVEMYLLFAESQARRGNIMYMTDWVQKLDGFLQFNDRDVLQHIGKISHELAVELAEKQFDIYHEEKNKMLVSDFDEVVLQTIESAKNKKPVIHSPIA